MGVVVLDKKAREKLLRTELNRVVSILKSDEKILKIILFGSLATGNIAGDSDIDLLIIKDTKERPVKRTEEIYQKISPNTSIDILVYNDNELNEMEKTSSFIRKILKEGSILYAKETC